MKKFNCLLVTLVGMLIPGAAMAQLPGAGQGMNAALLKLFGEVNAFSAHAEVGFQDKDSRQQVSLPVEFAWLDGKLRLDLDLGRMKSAQVPTQMLATLKMAGLDKAVTILRPDLKKVVMIYPNITSYAEMPMASDEAEDWQRHYNVQYKKLGRESVDGKPCDKQQVTVIGDNGVRNEATVWYSQEPRPFPMKLQMAQPRASVTMQFRDVKLTRPEASLFQAGPGLTQYRTVEALTQAAMAKALGAK